MPGLNSVSNLIKSSLQRAKNTVFALGGYLSANWLSSLFKVGYLAVLITVAVNIYNFSYKAWLYPVREHQYFDECSYIAMGKFFRTISPVELLKDYIAKDEPLPKLYHEFHSRMVYWPIILAPVLEKTEDRIELHKFRATFLAIGTVLFFLLGFKLGGITGGTVASAFWIATPILNYWGHFLMTENPSFVFIAAGYLFLLCSNRSAYSSVLGGFFLGLAAFTRFTTIVLIFPAPFLIAAVYVNPFKRRDYQFMGECAKVLGGFVVATLPYLIASALLYDNPLRPFLAARHNVDAFPVDDPLYYLRNTWLEAGEMLRKGAKLAIAAPIFTGLAWSLRVLRKQLNSKSRLTFGELLLIYPPVFLRAVVYTLIVILSLVFTSSIYILQVSDIPHKIARYIMGGIIPLLIVSAIGFGAIELLLIQLIRLPLGRFSSFISERIIKRGPDLISLLKGGKEGITKAVKGHLRLKNGLIAFFCLLWAILTIITLNYLPGIARNVWDYSMNRPFKLTYEVPPEVTAPIKNKTTIKRLQPEYVAWEESINERLAKAAADPEAGIDRTQYLSDSYTDTYKFLNKEMKAGEVLYVDKLTLIPFLPAYVEGPVVEIDRTYGYSLNTLFRKGEFPYKGYVVAFNQSWREFFGEGEDAYFRSVNLPAVKRDNRFEFIKRHGFIDLYYYSAGEDYPYRFGTGARIAALYGDEPKESTVALESEAEEVVEAERGSSLFKELLSSWTWVFKTDYVIESDVTKGAGDAGSDSVEEVK